MPLAVFDFRSQVVEGTAQVSPGLDRLFVESVFEDILPFAQAINPGRFGYLRLNQRGIHHRLRTDWAPANNLHRSYMLSDRFDDASNLPTASERNRAARIDRIAKVKLAEFPSTKEYLANAPKVVSVADVFKVNGGLPAKTDLKYKESISGATTSITFESEPGLVTPGILVQGTSTANEITIYVSDDGKSAELERHKDHIGLELYLDILGTGELSEFDLRYPIYSGRSVAFTGGWQIARVVEEIGRAHV